jgi:hypothetical protein
MKLSRVGMMFAVLAVATMIAPSVNAQDWDRRRDRERRHDQPPPAQPRPGIPPQIAVPPGGGACVPSGFARLSRNCTINTGGCQRMPESCNRGWCCP